MKRRFNEREEACANLARATEEARMEKESKAGLKQAQSERESSLREEVCFRHPYLSGIISVRRDVGPSQIWENFGTGNLIHGESGVRGTS